MDRYQKVEKPKVEMSINENEIRITSQGRMRSCITISSSSSGGNVNGGGGGDLMKIKCSFSLLSSHSKVSTSVPHSGVMNASCLALFLIKMLLYSQLLDSYSQLVSEMKNNKLSTKEFALALKGMGDPIWAISSDTINSLIGLSLNFFFIPPLTNSVGIHLIEAPVLHPMSEGLFNFVIAWTLMFDPLLYTDGQRDGFKGSIDLLWGFQMFLTNSYWKDSGS